MSQMTGRERVLRALEFNYPDHVPRDLWVLPIARLEHGTRALDQLMRRWPVDVVRAGVPATIAAELQRGNRHNVGSYRDEWGCEFVNLQAGVHGEVKQPLIDDWSKLEDLVPPWALLDLDRDAINRRVSSTDQFVFADAFARPFERLQFLRGTENVYMDLADESPELRQLLMLIHDFYCKEMAVWAETDIDAIMVMDDWGSQRSMLVKPDLWRRWFKPLYAEYVRIAHDAGKKLLLHSDGWIFDIYEDLIEIGIDAVNSQLFVMDIEQIGRCFGGRMTFWGEIDRQHILCRGTRQEARAAVERVAHALCRPEGGVIAQFEFGAGANLEIAEEIFGVWQSITSQQVCSAQV